MTWEFIIPLIIFSLFKIMVTCQPTAVVEWILSKFETHSKLDNRYVTVSITGKRLDNDDKIQVINAFNEAVFIKKYYIWPGTEDLYLYPESGVVPIIMDTKKGKNDVKLFLFMYESHIDVVKKYKKKVIAYSLYTDSFQNNCLNKRDFSANQL